ncbi:MAG: N-acetylneuraminate synthase family protein [Magnetospirillum sp.]|nr:N-acetylneuraminate synthase family protein [Magnetospirillum sp.]
MQIDRNIQRFIVFAEDSIQDALRKISQNKSRIVFTVTASGHLEGVVTDGDFRRWVVACDDIDLDRSVSAISNKELVTARISDPMDKIRALFSERVQYIPLLDAQGHLLAVARQGGRDVEIGPFQINDQAPTMVIAEIGNNHNGSMDLAIRLIDEAVGAGADCIKFQMRDMSTLYRNNGNAADASEDLGSQYVLDLLSRFNLSQEQMFTCFDHCKKRGVLPLCTPWDLESVRALEQYGIAGYKVASADLTNHDLLKALAATGKPLLVSTGMSEEAEIVEAVQLLRGLGAPFVLLHCCSTYPPPFKDINLRYLQRLKEISGGPVGYSGHERGYYVAIAAVAQGARVIEKHFTLDRAMEGNDHKVSLLPAEFAAMVQGIREVEESFGSDQRRRLTQGEMMNREVLAKSLMATTAIAEGAVIDDAMVGVVSPGKGLQPNMRGHLVGRRANRAMKPGDFFFPSDLQAAAVMARDFRYRRPWGLPVRFHDWRRILERSNPDFLEYHLSYKDLELDLGAFFTEPLDVGLVVHAPELFGGDHVVDLCSSDAAYRARSIAEMQRVVDITRALKRWHPNTARPVIITNVGGFSEHTFLPPAERPRLYDLVRDSLSKVDAAGVEIIPQTMPPFPWHFGGQRYHNLFVSADEILAFCRSGGMRVCLDVSHSKLACNHFGWSMVEFVDKVGPFTAHLHLVDARGVDDEGLQIGDGEIDFGALAQALDRTAPQVGFIPEIWQGHKNDGEGFWVALDRLEAWF